MARNPPKPKKWLVFIDTNILLDFYRKPGDSAIRQLKALEKHRESLILGDQLSMEFLKNRQAAIVAGIQAMQKPVRPIVPSVLLDAQAAKTLIKNYAATEKKWQQSKKRIEKMLTNPSTADPVYQHLMRIFDHDGDFNLKRPNKVRFTIRNLARKRFALGYRCTLFTFGMIGLTKRCLKGEGVGKLGRAAQAHVIRRTTLPLAADWKAAVLLRISNS